MTDEMEIHSVEAKYRAELTITQAHRAFGDHVEHWLDVCRRTRDYL
jgi:hypothetical protein